MSEERVPSSPPLAGVHVVDFGHWVAGPFAAHVLGELGATVVKVDSFAGDPLNRSLPGPYAVVNRGKLSLAIDLKAPGAREVVKRLVRWSDVVTYNFRPGVADRLGISREQVNDIDPSVVVVETTAYGLDGPAVERPGFDPVFSAVAGLAWCARGSAAGPPSSNTRLGPIDCGTGMLGAFAAVTALYRSRRSGVGGSTAVSLLDASQFLMGEVERDSTGAVTGAALPDGERTGSHPAEALYQLKDGWVALVATDEDARRSMVRSLGLPALASRPSAAWTAEDRAAIEEVLRRTTHDELTTQLAGIRASVVPCATDGKQRVLSSARLVDAGLVARSAEPAAGTFVGFPVEFERSRVASSSRMHVPQLGEHTDRVLRVIGFDDDEIAALHESNVLVDNSSS